MGGAKAHLSGIGAALIVALALGLLMAADHSGWAESTPAGTTAKTGAVAKGSEKTSGKGTEKAAERTEKSEKVAEKAGSKEPLIPAGQVPLPHPRPRLVAAAPPAPTAQAPVAQAPTAQPKMALASLNPAAPSAPTRAATPPMGLDLSAADLDTLKQAITLARNGKTGPATDLQKSLDDPLARKLIEWVLLRSDDNTGDYSRYAAFISANPSWPGIRPLRRRAEAMLWQEQDDPAFVRAVFAKDAPLSAKGHLALARAMLVQGDRAGAQAQVRVAWRNEALGMDLEDQVYDMFKDLLTPADHHARMEMRLYAEDVDGGLRAASRGVPVTGAVAKAWAGLIRKAPNVKALMEAVPAEAEHDAGFIFARAQWLRRDNHDAEAAQLILSTARDPAQPLDTDKWWEERRVLARKLLDDGDPATAYQIVRDAAVPEREGFRWEQQFTPGWIALRFLNDPATALVHFTKVGQTSNSPTTLARAGYWQGRAAEALGRRDEARAYYEAAARHGTAYYGQLARSRLGYQDMLLRPPPEISPERRAAIGQMELVRATELLYAIGERDLVISFVADIGDRSNDIALLAAVAEIAGHNGDARAATLVAKPALARGLPLEHYAFPTFGIPDYQTIGPAVDASVVYAIARQESVFNQSEVSSAKAMGLMQVTPEAGKETAKRFNATYDEKRLLSDAVYNVQMGAAELGDRMSGYRGSYILTFAGYNAGPGSVRKWIASYGDPRDPKVDPVDWVERIPFSETRNYVERVMENLQVYRVRLGGGPRLMIEADLHRGAAAD
jgi:soluble lytic murein transglycosylase